LSFSAVSFDFRHFPGYIPSNGVRVFDPPLRLVLWLLSNAFSRLSRLLRVLTFLFTTLNWLGLPCVKLRCLPQLYQNFDFLGSSIIFPLCQLAVSLNTLADCSDSGFFRMKN